MAIAQNGSADESKPKRGKGKKKRAVPDQGLKFDIGSLTTSTLSGLAAFFGALDKSNSRKPAVYGNVKIGKKKQKAKKQA